jgi:hypothetical protein
MHTERLIWRAATKAGRQGVTKDVFIVNFGDQVPVEGTLADLASYNDNHSSGHVRELWVLIGSRLEAML